jgi:hypothetical protein
MTETSTRAYRISRWLAVHLLALGLRHGLTDAEGLDALRRAYRHRAASVQWRLSILDDANRRNAERHWKGSPWAALRRGRRP